MSNHKWSVGEPTMPRVRGKAFVCSCGCNVFTKSSDKGIYACNACLVEYASEEYEHPRVVDEDFLDMLERRGTDPNVVNRIRRANERVARQWFVVVHIESEVEFALEASGLEEARQLAHEQARRLVPEGGRYTLALIERGQH